MLAIHGLLPEHTLPTRQDNCLDHFISYQLKSAQIEVLNTSITDHQMIFLSLQKQKPTPPTGKTKMLVNFDGALLSLAQKILPDLIFSDNPNFVVDQLITN